MPRMRKSNRRRIPRYPTYPCCSGPSASWWPWLLFHRALWRRLLSLEPAALWEAVVPAPGHVQSAFALGRGGTRLDRRRIWPPTLDHRWRHADLPRRLQRARVQCRGKPRGLRDLLYGARRRRCRPCSSNISVRVRTPPRSTPRLPERCRNPSLPTTLHANRSSVSCSTI